VAVAREHRLEVLAQLDRDIARVVAEAVLRLALEVRVTSLVAPLPKVAYDPGEFQHVR
jgi:hypothetical protein